MSKKIVALMAAVAMFFAVATTSAFAAELQTGVDWSKGVVRAKGLAAGKATTKNPGLRKAQAKRAATMDAQRNLAEAVRGVQVTGESTMKDLELEYDIVRTRVDAVINGMVEVDEKYFDDDTCEVILEMPLFGSAQSLATAAFLPDKNQPKIPFPQPSTNIDITINQNTAVGAASSSMGYTGLIVDCSGLNLNPVMSPVIKNDGGQSIYGHRNLDYDKIIERGMASYASSANDEISKTRAGNNPLVVKAVKLEGINANPVVSVVDADRILIANKGDKFLDNCAVVFIQ